MRNGGGGEKKKKNTYSVQSAPQWELRKEEGPVHLLQPQA